MIPEAPLGVSAKMVLYISGCMLICASMKCHLNATATVVIHLWKMDTEGGTVDHNSQTIFYCLNFIVIDGFLINQSIKYCLNYCCDWQFQLSIDNKILYKLGLSLPVLSCCWILRVTTGCPNLKERWSERGKKEIVLYKICTQTYRELTEVLRDWH
jgi:hypothetical protein